MRNCICLPALGVPTSLLAGWCDGGSGRGSQICPLPNGLFHSGAAVGSHGVPCSVRGIFSGGACTNSAGEASPLPPPTNVSLYSYEVHCRGPLMGWHPGMSTQCSLVALSEPGNGFCAGVVNCSFRNGIAHADAAAACCLNTAGEVQHGG